MIDRVNIEIEAGDIVLDLRGNQLGFIAGGQTPTGRVRVFSSRNGKYSVCGHYLIKIPLDLAIEIHEKHREHRIENGWWRDSQQEKWETFRQKLDEQL